MKKIYIAGKVTGEPRLECAAKFQNAADLLSAKGFEAVNPLKVVGTWDTTWQDAMKKCIAALTGAEALYLLPCWIDSPGARFEVEVANKLEIPVFTLVDELLQFQIT